MQKGVGQVMMLTVIAALIVVGIGGYFIFKYQQELKGQTINSFDECMKAGYPVMESYPAQCRTDDGRNFVQVIENSWGEFEASSGGKITTLIKDQGTSNTINQAQNLVIDSEKRWNEVLE